MILRNCKSAIVILTFAPNCTIAVDETLFFSSLDKIEACDASISLSSSPSRPSAGFQACYFMLFCMSNRFCPGGEGEEALLKYALDYIDVAMCRRPDQHLISALLLLTIFQYYKEGDSIMADACTFADLANTLSDFVPDLCPSIMLSATCFKKKSASLYNARAAVWPPMHPPIGALVAMYLPSRIRSLGTLNAGPFDVPSCRHETQQSLEGSRLIHNNAVSWFRSY